MDIRLVRWFRGKCLVNSIAFFRLHGDAYIMALGTRQHKAIRQLLNTVHSVPAAIDMHMSNDCYQHLNS